MKGAVMLLQVIPHGGTAAGSILTAIHRREAGGHQVAVALVVRQRQGGLDATSAKWPAS